MQSRQAASIRSSHFYFLDPLPGASSSYAPFAIIANLAVTILGFLLIGLIVMDWQTHLLPDAFTLTGIAAGLFLICTQAIFLGPTEDQVVLGAPSTSQALEPPPTRATSSSPARKPSIGGRILAAIGVAFLLLSVRWIYRVSATMKGWVWETSSFSP